MRYHASALALALSLVAPAFAGEIRGRVLVDGKPAAGVAVSVLPFEDGLAEARREARREAAPRPLATASSRPDGAFSLVLSAPADAVFRLAFSGGGAPALRLDAFVAGGGQDVGDVRLPRAGALAGRVTDERGGPVVGADVTLWAGRGGLREAVALQAVPLTTSTRADGSFRFEAASEEGNALRVEAAGFASAGRSSLRAGALTRPLALAPGRVLRGTVLQADRRTPARGALVRYEGPGGGRGVVTSADGRFVLEGVPREAGSLVANAGEQGRVSAGVASSSVEPLALVLAPPSSLSGRVVDAETARPLAAVRLVIASGASRVLARSGPDGRYAVSGLAPERQRLEVDDERYVPWSRSVALLPGQAEAQDVLLVRAATLAGRVLNEEGAPIEGARLQLTRSGENVFAAFVRSMEGSGTVRSGRNGAFVAKRLAPGERQRLDISHDDYEQRSIAGISLAPGATRSGLTVVLRSGLAVRGRVKDEDGRPLAGAQLTLSHSRTLRAGRGGVQMTIMGAGGEVRRETGADGRFEFRGLKAGDYSLAARRAGSTRTSVDVKVAEAGSEPVEIVLRPGASVSGFVRDRTGAPAAGFFVSAAVAGGPTMGPGALAAEEPTGPDGFFAVDGLTTGESYDLSVMGPTGPAGRRAGVVAPAEGLELAVSGNGQLRGRVVDAESGRPVTDFDLRYEPDAQGQMRIMFRGSGRSGRGPFERHAFHAEDGAFSLDEVPAGRWLLQAYAPGYQPGSAAGLAVGEGETLEGVEIRVSRGGVVSGRVLDARSGRVVLDATVRAEQSGGPGMRMRSVVIGGQPGENESSTDAEGRYEIAGLAPGTWTLTASHVDWCESTTTVELKDAPVSADLRLGRGGSVSGVVSAAGRPVGGASVALSIAGEAGFRAGVGFSGPTDQAALSDEAGRFRFERLPPGRYSLSASLREQSSNAVEAVVTGEENQEVQLSLGAGAVIHGVVTGLPEAQLASVRVSASARDYFADTRTAAGGAFELTGVPEGAVTLSASAGDFLASMRSASTTVTIAAGQAEASAEIAFEAGFRVDGHVTRAGRPVTDATVFASPEGGGGRSRTASSRTDEGGGYVLEGLAEGSYTISALGQSAAPITRTVAVSGDTTVDLEAPPARLGGTVVEAEAGRPLAEVSVRIESDAGAGAHFTSVSLTDSSGRFRFEDLEPGPYRVSFQKAAYQVEQRDLVAGDDPADARVELRRAEGIGIEAKDGLFATPLRGLFVRVVDGTGQAAFSGSVSLDSEGRGEIPAVKPGVYEVRAQSSGYAAVSLPGVAVPSRTIALALTPGGSLEIQAGPQTLALPKPTARLLGPGGRPHAWNVFSPDGAISLGEAVRSLENVAPGRYTLAVDGGATRELTISEGGRTSVALP